MVKRADSVADSSREWPDPLGARQHEDRWYSTRPREVDRLQPTDLACIQHEYALPATAARLDALAALKERSLVERDAPPLLQPRIYLEPFARALGAVREYDLLIEQAVDRFAAMGLAWHAQQSRKLLAPT